MALDTSSAQLRRSVSPSPQPAALRLREQLRSGSLASTGTLVNAAGALGTSSSATASRAAHTGSPGRISQAEGGWRDELEAVQAQLRMARTELDKVRETQESQAKQTEAALVEVCKSLGMQQQQLEHQEMCTGMIHQLLQEFIPGLPAVGAGGSKAASAQTKPIVCTSIDDMSTLQVQLQTRTESVESSVGTLQKGLASLQQQLALVSAGTVKSTGMLTECHDSRKGTMETLEAANCALGDLLAEMAPTQATSAGSSPEPSNKTSHFADDQLSSGVLASLRVDLEHPMSKQLVTLQGKQAALELLTGTLREEQQAGLSQLSSSVRGELEAVRGEALNSVMSCWRELQLRQGMESHSASGVDMEARMNEVSQSFRKELATLRQEFHNVYHQRFQKSFEVMASAQDQQSKEFSRQLDDVKCTMKDGSQLHIKHRELCYLVNVQQNMLSQHTEELETLRHEQHEGLTSVTSSMKQKLDAVSELSRLLHHKVETVCSQSAQAPLWNHVQDTLATVRQQQPDPSDVVRVLRSEIDSVSGAAGSLQKEFDTACRRASSTSPRSSWPMLQQKLAELSTQVHEIDDASQRSNEGSEPRPEPSHSSSAGAIRESPQLVGPFPLLEGTSRLSELTQNPCYHFGGIANDVPTSPCSPSGQGSASGFPQALLGQHAQTPGDQVNGSGGGSWRNLKEEVCSAVNVLDNACAEPFAFHPALPRPAAVPPLMGDTPFVFEAPFFPVELDSVLQSLQEADRSFVAELGVSTCGEPVASPLAANAGWWSELEDKHPDLAQLVQTQRSELARIGGSQNLASSVGPKYDCS